MKRADYVLYTDVDILFMRDFELERRLLPRWLSFAVQVCNHTRSESNCSPNFLPYYLQTIQSSIYLSINN